LGVEVPRHLFDQVVALFSSRAQIVDRFLIAPNVSLMTRLINIVGEFPDAPVFEKTVVARFGVFFRMFSILCHIHDRTLQRRRLGTTAELDQQVAFLPAVA